MSTSKDVFSLIGFNDLFDLCRDTDELGIFFFFFFFLLKSVLLGDRSGVCKICGKGNINLTKQDLKKIFKFENFRHFSSQLSSAYRVRNWIFKYFWLVRNVRLG